MTFSACALPLLGLLGPASNEDTPSPSGRYAEARTASVFAGACHFGGEAVTTGRSALCVWRIEQGAFDGVDLAGVKLAALVTAEANLAEDVARRSVVYVDSPDAVRGLAALRWLAATRAEIVGDVVLVRATSIETRIEDETYRVRAGDWFELDGGALPDRACCKMPYEVWYRPFETQVHALVGQDESFGCSEPALGLAWSRPNENAAFFGVFGATAAESAPR